MNKKSNKYLVLFAVIALVCLTAGITTAAPVTRSITYQGKLTSAAGSPLTGTYSVTFTLYDASTGGTVLCTDTQSVTAANGLFTTPIAVTDPKVADGRALWLGIKVGSDAEMTPRQEIRPVPYALSLRPGATVMASLSPWALKVQNSAGTGLTAITSNDFNPGLLANTSGDHSSGLHSETHGDYSPGMSAITKGIRSPGVHAEMSGEYSPGMSTITKGIRSPGVYAETHGVESAGMSTNTTAIHSSGVHTETHGDYSPGMSAFTNGTFSPGVFVNTLNASSPGMRAVTSGFGSHGVFVETYGIGAEGVHAYSGKFNGIFAATGNATHQYGVYTPDKMSALGYDTNSGDIAEYMPVAGVVTPGTVLVIGDDGKLRTSTTAYDTGIAGIVSTAPGVTLGTKDNGNPGEQIIAIAGRVPCKVDASNGPVHPRDLLTTSNNPGYAMKATDPRIGTVLGKAMGTLESGTGTIEVLVTLQ